MSSTIWYHQQRQYNSKINKWDYIQLRVSAWKNYRLKLEDSYVNGKISALNKLDKGLVSGYIKYSQWSTFKRSKTLSKNWERKWKILFRGKQEWSVYTWKIAKYHLLQEKYKSRYLWNTTSHQCEWHIMKIIEVMYVGRDVMIKELTASAHGNFVWYIPCGKQYGAFLVN